MEKALFVIGALLVIAVICYFIWRNNPKTVAEGKAVAADVGDAAAKVAEDVKAGVADLKK
jgi:hypothetical protein